MRYAVITAVEANRVKLKLKGDSVASQIPYYHLASYEPSIDDVVLVDTDLKIVIGKVKIN